MTWGNGHCRVLSSHRQGEEGEREDGELHFYDKRQFYDGCSEEKKKKSMNESILYKENLGCLRRLILF